jgi:hypothetical protein
MWGFHSIVGDYQNVLEYSTVVIGNLQPTFLKIAASNFRVVRGEYFYSLIFVCAMMSIRNKLSLSCQTYLTSKICYNY